MAASPLFELGEHSQSVWYDSISRSMITSGGLKKLIDAYTVVGVTSNPTIFEKAIADSADYDADIRALAEVGHRAPQIYEQLATDCLLYFGLFGPHGVYSLSKEMHRWADHRNLIPLKRSDTPCTSSGAKATRGHRLPTSSLRPG